MDVFCKCSFEIRVFTHWNVRVSFSRQDCSLQFLPELGAQVQEAAIESSNATLLPKSLSHLSHALAIPRSLEISRSLEPVAPGYLYMTLPSGYD